ncbi:MAG: DUF1566 domain-containing protein [Candidatus Pacearchaeota archaeon]|nr:DUF1566 domain-containing protein [Candidatus Pacearchaeota archaeon]
MKKGDKLKNILGWTAVIITLIVNCFWSYWGILEFFHEGWYSSSILYSLFLLLFQYMLFTIIFIVFPLIALKYKKIGLACFIALGIFAAYFFSGASFQVTYLLLSLPLIGLGVLFYFGNPKKIKIARILIILLPLIIITLFGTPQLIKNIQRIDDGNYGMRTLDCQGTPLVWAGKGSGFPDTGYNWTDSMYICEHLSEDGTTVLNESQNIWRIPGIEEAIRCQMIHNENAGGIWNPDTKKAEYEKTPDKETPIWVPNSEIIYYWTSELSSETENQAYIIDYAGGIFDKDIRYSPNYRAFRCVKDAG